MARRHASFVPCVYVHIVQRATYDATKCNTKRKAPKNANIPIVYAISIGLIMGP